MFDTIDKYGITLRRLTHDKIELVRQWRNHPKIARYMEYREKITPEMQERWFQRINNEFNYYYLICVDGKEIGLNNIRDIDFDTKTGEGGVFIWDDDYLNSTVPYAAAYALGDLYFETLGFEKVIIHVMKDNPRAIKFNKSLGYILSPGQEDVMNQEYTLDYKRYLEKRNKIQKYLK